MEVTVQYSDESERQILMSEHFDKYLIAERNIKEGNFLIFSLEKPFGVQLEELKTQNEALGLTVDSILTDVIPSLFG